MPQSRCHHACSDSTGAQVHELFVQVHRVTDELKQMVTAGLYVSATRAMIQLKYSATKKASSGNRGGGGGSGKIDGDAGGGDDEELQVVAEVLEEDRHRMSVAVQQYSSNLFRTERAIVSFDKLHIFDRRICTINRTYFTSYLKGFGIVGNIERVGAIAGTIYRQDLLENITSDAVIDFVKKLNVVHDGARAHISGGHNRHALFG